MRPQTPIDQARGQRSRCVRSASRPRAIHNAWRRLSSSRQSRHRTAATADRLPSCVNWSKSPGAARRPHSSSCRRLGGMVPPPLGISARRGAAGASTGDDGIIVEESPEASPPKSSADRSDLIVTESEAPTVAIFSSEQIGKRGARSRRAWRIAQPMRAIFAHRRRATASGNS